MKTEKPSRYVRKVASRHLCRNLNTFKRFSLKEPNYYSNSVFLGCVLCAWVVVGGHRRVSPQLWPSTSALWASSPPSTSTHTSLSSTKSSRVCSHTPHASQRRRRILKPRENGEETIIWTEDVVPCTKANHANYVAGNKSLADWLVRA